MGWVSIAEFLAASIIGGSFADWLFFGVLFHSKYSAFPETWRGKEGEQSRIILSMALGILTPLGFLYAMNSLQIVSALSLTKFVASLMLMLVLPINLTNFLFMKLHPLILLSHSLGWLAKLVLCGVAGWWFLT